jgi:hypothetical protein
LYALITLPTRASMSCSTPSGASGASSAIARTATRAAGARAERRATERRGAAAAMEFTARRAKAIVRVSEACATTSVHRFFLLARFYKKGVRARAAARRGETRPSPSVF